MDCWIVSCHMQKHKVLSRTVMLFGIEIGRMLTPFWHQYSSKMNRDELLSRVLAKS